MKHALCAVWKVVGRPYTSNAGKDDRLLIRGRAAGSGRVWRARLFLLSILGPGGSHATRCDARRLVLDVVDRCLGGPPSRRPGAREDAYGAPRQRTIAQVRVFVTHDRYREAVD